MFRIEMKVTCPLFKKTWHLSSCDKRMDLKKTYERILWPSSFCVAWPFKIWVIMALHNLLSLVAFKNLFFSLSISHPPPLFHQLFTHARQVNDSEPTPVTFSFDVSYDCQIRHALLPHYGSMIFWLSHAISVFLCSFS